MTEFKFKTTPFAHQREAFTTTRSRPACAFFWEMGTGKSKIILDTAAWLFTQKRIDTLVVIAPNGVHRNWIVNEIPTHLAVPATTFLYLTSKSGGKRFREEAKKALAAPGFLIVALSYDAVMTKNGDAFLVAALTRRVCMMVLDESARIKTPRAQRTIRLLARSKSAVYRRVLTGTPVANSPFDVFTQIKFLNHRFWDSIGCHSFAAFKNLFGIWEDRMDPRSGRAYKNLVKYRNLKKLHDMVDQIATRVTKDEVLDLPPKLYVKRYFTLSSEQQHAYDLMASDWTVRLQGGEITAMLAIVQLLRFQQITSGFAVDVNDNILDLGKVNPRITALLDIISETTGQFIVWAKFQHDVGKICAALKEDGITAVRYDGTTSDIDRAHAIEAFQSGQARAFVGNPAAAGEGLTLHAARTVIYYNNSFKLTDRLQSEDRAHRIGQSHPVTYIDIVAEDTVDEKIVNALRDKRDIASIITGDILKEWI